MLVPFPRLPYWLLPQHLIVPLVSTAHERRILLAIFWDSVPLAKTVIDRSATRKVFAALFIEIPILVIGILWLPPRRETKQMYAGS